MMNDPQLSSRNFWREMEHPDLGERVLYPGPFVTMTETPLALRGKAPKIGEHNEEIYVRELGVSHDELRGLKEFGII
jgi:crotonobetainyl-CoA:carnitine CoA-transferase CaiB-like acyl-CoA transferase